MPGRLGRQSGGESFVYYDYVVDDDVVDDHDKLDNDYDKLDNDYDNDHDDRSSHDHDDGAGVKHSGCN